MNERGLLSVTGRRWFLVGLFSVVALLLLARAVDLQLLRKDFLQDHGDARYLRVVDIPAHRGMIQDRNGEPLAVSTPVSSVWAAPGKLLRARARWPVLARVLGMQREQLQDLVLPRKNRGFVYLRRHVTPDMATRVMALNIEGVSLQREFHRYYPAGEVAAHVVGFTNVDDRGQEGVELAFDQRLQGSPGSKRVLKDGRGRIVENVEGLRTSQRGEDLSLSIDRRIQYIAYRELKAAVVAYQAKAGSIVVIDSHRGEILALANQPSYNPNNRSEMKGEYYRNRAVTDAFEPGSTIKPFTIAAALESGAYTPQTLIDTAPGFYKLGTHTIRDTHNYGRLDVTGVITKSSNVGASRIALSLDPKRLWGMFNSVGFGQVPGGGLPGETTGRLNDYRDWREIGQATMAFGYGLSMSLLQLAQAYAILANDGIALPLSIEKRAWPGPGRRVMQAVTAAQLRKMLESVITRGTGRLAHVSGYRVAGKTGTVHKAIIGGYAVDRYLAVFAGMAPVSRPRLVIAVMIDEPSAGTYYGGKVAAPVFARVMGESLRLLAIAPDNTDELGQMHIAMHVPAGSGGDGVK